VLSYNPKRTTLACRGREGERGRMREREREKE